RFGVGLAVNVVIERVQFLLALVFDRDSSVLLKWQREIRVYGVIRRGGERQRLVGEIFPQPEAEEIADGSFDAGRRFAVPIHSDDNFFEVIHFVGCEREPDMRDDARSRLVEDGEGFAGGDGTKIFVAAGAVVTGDAFLDVVVRFGEAGDPVARLRGQSSAGDQEQNAQTPEYADDVHVGSFFLFHLRDHFGPTAS